ncbi:MAG: efflux RND transporter periplasmic adaptor subunit [Blastocatellia bacterium]|nr:efflux RND transporter periplasmic adaptor subunit [Blastocatellia bacterium]
MRFRLLFFFIVMLGLNGCSRPASTPKAEHPAVTAKVETIHLTDTAETYEAVGTVTAKTSTVLAARMMGQVTAVQVHEGDHVKAGQTLVTLDHRDAAASVKKATAGLQEVEHALVETRQAITAAELGRQAAEANRVAVTATYERYRTLYERKSISRQEMDEVTARYQTATAETARSEAMIQAAKAKQSQMQARMEQAQADISGTQVVAGYATIAAPFAGVVTMKAVEVGQMAVPGMPLLKLESGGTFRLEVAVDESKLSLIQLGKQVSVSIDALGHTTLFGKVAEIVPAADAASRSFTVKIDLPQQNGMRSGMFGRALFPIGERPVLTVPATAVLERGQLTGVWVVDSNRIARLRLVKTGKTIGDRVEILSGLEDGLRIVSNGPERISEGNQIQD